MLPQLNVNPYAQSPQSLQPKKKNGRQLSKDEYDFIDNYLVSMEHQHSQQKAQQQQSRQPHPLSAVSQRSVQPISHIPAFDTRPPPLPYDITPQFAVQQKEKSLFEQFNQMKSELIEPLQKQIHRQNKQINKFMDKVDSSLGGQKPSDQSYQQSLEIAQLKNQIQMLQNEKQRQVQPDYMQMMQMMMMNNKSEQNKGFEPQQMMQIQMMIQQTQQQNQMNNILAQGGQQPTVVNPPPQNNFIPVPQTQYPPHYPQNNIQQRVPSHATHSLHSHHPMKHSSRNRSPTDSVITFVSHKPSMQSTLHQKSEQPQERPQPKREKKKEKRKKETEKEKEEREGREKKEEEERVEKERKEEEKKRREEEEKKKREEEEAISLSEQQEWTRKESEQKGHEETLPQALSEATSWAQSLFSFYYESISKNSNNLQFLTKGSSPVRVKVLSETTVFLEKMLAALPSLPPPVLSFLKAYANNRVYLPNNFLFTFELAQLQFDPKYGFTSDMTPSAQEVLLVMFLVVRVVVANLLFNPEAVSAWCQGNKKKIEQESKNCEQWAQVIFMHFQRHLDSLELGNHLESHSALDSAIKVHPVKEPADASPILSYTLDKDYSLVTKPQNSSGKSFMRNLKHHKIFEKAFTLDKKCAPLLDANHQLVAQIMAALLALL